MLDFHITGDPLFQVFPVFALLLAVALLNSHRLIPDIKRVRYEGGVGDTSRLASLIGSHVPPPGPNCELPPIFASDLRLLVWGAPLNPVGDLKIRANIVQWELAVAAKLMRANVNWAKRLQQVFLTENTMLTLPFPDKLDR